MPSARSIQRLLPSNTICSVKIESFGRMPSLDIINDRFARQFRITLQQHVRLCKSMSRASWPKYGEASKLPSHPQPLNSSSPLRGSCILAIESKLIFAFSTGLWSNKRPERIESRDFTAIELWSPKVIGLLLDDLQDAWSPAFLSKVSTYGRGELRALAVAALSDVVVLTSFETELDCLRGSVRSLSHTAPSNPFDNTSPEVSVAIAKVRTDVA